VLVLDTNHVSELGYGTPAGLRLRDRLIASDEDSATTIITVEEQLRGWLAKIHRLSDPHRQIPAYQRLQERIGLEDRLHRARS
jgi:tRNA(fMet)-specific endonuclease VapC